MKTILYDRHLALGAKMVAFGDWEMPLYYKGTVAEHLAVRNRVGLFDVSHMGRIDIEGENASLFMEYLCTKHITEQPNSSSSYAVMCHPSGGAVDDTIVYRIASNHYFIVANANNREKDLQHIMRYSHHFGCKVTSRFADIGIIALQGPQSPDVVEEVLKVTIALRAMQFAFVPFDNSEILISRTGYTGSVGYEFFAPLDVLGQLWDALLQTRRAPDILPCGLAARDTLRLEAGYALYGHELSDDIAPTESVSAWTVNWKKGDFVGKEALLHLENSFNKRAQYGIRLLDPGIAREGSQVWKGQRRIGVVTSGTHSPSLNCSIAIIMVTGTLAFGETVEVEIRGRKAKARVVKLPFVKL